MTRQLTVAAQSLMMTYETLSLQKDTLTKQVEVYEKALNLEKTKQAAGMSTAADVLEKENQLLSARAAFLPWKRLKQHLQQSLPYGRTGYGQRPCDL